MHGLVTRSAAPTSHFGGRSRLAFRAAGTQIPTMDIPATRRPTAGQLALAHAVAEGRNAMGESVTHVAASVYTDEERFTAEQPALFGKLPQVIAPSALLPRPNMPLPPDAFGVPLARKTGVW